MPRAKKTEADRRVDRYVGERVSLFRKDRGWTLEETSDKLGISVPYLKALESGRYSFSASMLCKLAAVFDRTPGAFLPNQKLVEPLDESWRQVLDALTRREQRAVLELAQYFVETPDEVRDLLRSFKRQITGPGILISFEGIDGALLHDQARRLVDRLTEEQPDNPPAVLSSYEFDTPLWRFMIDRFRRIGRASSTMKSPAFERTLLFACERLYRQEMEIVPNLKEKNSVVATIFFYLAPAVYQQVEELDDRSVIQAVEHFLIEPQLIVFLSSDPTEAARKVVSNRAPRPEELDQIFYSSYTDTADLEESLKLYDQAVATARRNGIEVAEVDGARDPDVVAAEVFYKVLSSKTCSERTPARP